MEELLNSLVSSINQLCIPELSYVLSIKRDLEGLPIEYRLLIHQFDYTNYTIKETSIAKMVSRLTSIYTLANNNQLPKLLDYQES